MPQFLTQPLYHMDPDRPGEADRGFRSLDTFLIQAFDQALQRNSFLRRKRLQFVPEDLLDRE